MQARQQNGRDERQPETRLHAHQWFWYPQRSAVGVQRCPRFLGYQGVLHGHDGVRRAAAVLHSYDTEHRYVYDQRSQV